MLFTYLKITTNLRMITQWLWRGGKSILFILWALWILNFNISPKLITNDYVHYENPAYCFELNYPSRWRVDSYGEQGYRGYEYERTAIYASGFSMYDVSIEQKPFLNPCIIDLEKWSKEELLGGNQSYQTNLEEIVINGQIVGSKIFTSTTTRSKWREIYIPRQADGLVIRLFATKNNFEEGNRIFEEVLASFTYDNTCP